MKNYQPDKDDIPPFCIHGVSVINDTTGKACPKCNPKIVCMICGKFPDHTHPITCETNDDYDHRNNVFGGKPTPVLETFGSAVYAPYLWVRYWGEGLKVTIATETHEETWEISPEMLGHTKDGFHIDISKLLTH